MDILIRNEKKEEERLVEVVVREAFWNVYKPGCDEHLMLHQLRLSEDFIPELDFVAINNGRIVANIVCSRCLVEDNDNNIVHNDIISIGPIGVLPDYQNKGIGGMLINMVKEESEKLGYKGIVLYGNPAYYHRFGFVNAAVYSVHTPDGTNFEDFMALELGDGRMQGIQGNCYESKAFEIKPDDLVKFETEFAF